MKERGKSLEPEHKNTNFFSNSNNFSSSSDLPCKKHPFNSPSVGICPYCLKDKLMDLVCSDCGEERLSSCSCTDMSSYRNSYCSLDVGSVGRISFLIENENGDEQKTLLSHMKQIKKSETERNDVVLLKRSSSCVVEVKKSNGFWKIGKLFKKKREKEGCSERNIRGGFDQKSEVCVIDVSRSRSLSSFMDGNFDHEVEGMACSSETVSDFIESEPQKSGFRGGLNDDDDDSEFIDLKIDLADKKVKNSHAKAWQGIFKHHSGN